MVLILQQQPLQLMMKEIVALEFESNCAVLKRKRDCRRMMIQAGHSSIPDRGGKVARSGEERESI